MSTVTKSKSKGAAKPLVKAAKAGKNPATTTAKTTLPGSADAASKNLPTTRADVAAARLAQIVNLHIAGYSLQQIGDAIGCSAAEVDRMLTQDTARYVKSQPALRVYVRNWISEKYGKMLKAVEPMATDPDHDQLLESQDRMLRILKEMARLHGAEAPVQSEIKVETAPEAVQKMVDALAQSNGLDYDPDIFDAEVIEDMVDEVIEETESDLLDASEMVGEDQPGDEEGL